MEVQNDVPLLPVALLHPFVLLSSYGKSMDQIHCIVTIEIESATIFVKDESVGRELFPNIKKTPPTYQS